MDILGEPILDKRTRTTSINNLFSRLKVIEVDNHGRRNTTPTRSDHDTWKRSIISWENKQFQRYRAEPSLYLDAVQKKIDQFDARIRVIEAEKRQKESYGGGYNQAPYSAPATHNHNLVPPSAPHRPQSNSYSDVYAPLPVQPEDPFAPLPVDFSSHQARQNVARQPVQPPTNHASAAQGYGNWGGMQSDRNNVQVYWQKLSSLRKTYFEDFRKLYPRIQEAARMRKLQGDKPTQTEKLFIVMKKLRSCIEALQSNKMHRSGMQFLEGVEKECSNLYSKLRPPDHQRRQQQLLRQQQQRREAEAVQRAEQKRREEMQMKAQKAALAKAREEEQARKREADRLEKLKKEKAAKEAKARVDAENARKEQLKRKRQEEEQSRNKVVVIDLDSDTSDGQRKLVKPSVPAAQPAPVPNPIASPPAPIPRSSSQPRNEWSTCESSAQSKKNATLNYESSSGTPASQMTCSPVTGKSPLMPSTPGTVCDEHETTAMFRSNEQLLGPVLDSILTGYSADDGAAHVKSESAIVNAALTFNATAGTWSGDPMMDELSANRSAFLEQDWLSLP